MNYKKTVNYLYSIGYRRCVADSIILRWGTGLACKDKERIGDDIQENWKDFMEFYGKIKHELRPLRRNLNNFKK